MQMGLHKESMVHLGMNRMAMKEAALQNLAIGQQYRLQSVSATQNDNTVTAKCQLMELCKNFAVFKHKNGYTESFTYQEIWIQMMSGAFA